MWSFIGTLTEKNSSILYFFVEIDTKVQVDGLLPHAKSRMQRVLKEGSKNDLQHHGNDIDQVGNRTPSQIEKQLCEVSQHFGHRNT